MEKRKAATERALQSIASFAPVEDVGLAWLDHTAHVEDLRDIARHVPENGKLPALVEGVQRLPGPQEVIASLTNGEAPPPAFLASFGRGKRDGAEDFRRVNAASLRATVPLVPQLDGNYLQIHSSCRSRRPLLTDATLRIIPLDGRPHLRGPLRGWSGDARGHWESDTLVVETTNFNNRDAQLRRRRTPAEESGDRALRPAICRTSSSTRRRSWTPRRFRTGSCCRSRWARLDSRIYEDACHEHNYKPDERAVRRAQRKSGRRPQSRPIIAFFLFQLGQPIVIHALPALPALQPQYLRFCCRTMSNVAVSAMAITAITPA